MANHSKSSIRRLFEYHSLSLVVLAIAILWVVLYDRSDPNSHLGAFYGNAIADWSGAFIIMVVTKYFHEKGSTESRPFKDRAKTLFTRFLVEHSLSLFLLICAVAVGVTFYREDPNSKWGEVAGNLLSQFIQLLGLVLLTKKLFEKDSEED